MNFFEILYAQKNGVALPANFFDLLFAKSFTPVTEWGEYDGTLPARYSANGSALADYRIYGANGGVGDDSGTAYGYEVPMRISHKSALTSDDFQIGVWLVSNGAFAPLPYYLCTQKFPLESRALNVYAKLGKRTNAMNIVYYRGNTYLEYQMVQDYNDYEARISGEAPTGATEFAISIGRYQGVNLYPSDIEVFDINWPVATPSIYISDTPLGEDEYISYSEQKIYRMSGGTLTPTDPPVPLPALPTVDGINLVEYAGQSADPSRFYAKYQKG